MVKKVCFVILVLFFTLFRFAQAADLIVDGDVGIGDTAPDAKLDVLNTGTGASFRVDDDADGDTTPFIIDTDGLVGIGTAAPAEALEVTGNIKLSGASALYKITNVLDPTDAQDVATKAYVDANVGGGGVVWKGYVSSGSCADWGGKAGGDALCDGMYPGSHWATYNELMSLGSDFPPDGLPWVRAALIGFAADLSRLYSACFDENFPSANIGAIDCLDWTTCDSAGTGFRVELDNSFRRWPCDRTGTLGCVE